MTNQLAWYWIALITLGCYWTIGCIIAATEKDDWLCGWAMGPLYYVAYVLCYPIRAWRKYTAFEEHYKRQNITRWQYMFGKRPKRKE